MIHFAQSWVFLGRWGQWRLPAFHGLFASAPRKVRAILVFPPVKVIEDRSLRAFVQSLCTSFAAGEVVNNGLIADIAFPSPVRGARF